MSEFPRLDPDDLPDDAVVLVRQWLDVAAADDGVNDPRVASLATADADGLPDVRTVIVREVSDQGLLFTTTYTSAKAEQMDGQGAAALLLFWEPLMRQCRIRGTVRRMAAEEADERFARFDRDRQIMAWASDQRSELADRAALERAFEAAAERFPDDVPRPDHFGGYRLRPEDAEIWQGHPVDRLHDRFRYRRQGEGWSLARIAP